MLGWGGSSHVSPSMLPTQPESRRAPNTPCQVLRGWKHHNNSTRMDPGNELEPGTPCLHASPKSIYIVEEGLMVDGRAAARSLQVAAFLAIFPACLSINNNIYQLLWAYYVSRCFAYVNSLRTYYVLVCHLINCPLLLAFSAVLPRLPPCPLLLLCRFSLVFLLSSKGWGARAPSLWLPPLFSPSLSF